jgi:hypothetical protein
VPCRIVPRFLLAEFQRSTLAGKSALLKSIWQELLIFSGALYHKLSDGTLHIVNLWVWGVYQEAICAEQHCKKTFVSGCRRGGAFLG